MDVFLLIVTIITCIIFVVVNIYVIAIYKHRDESIVSVKNILCLILVMITLLQIEFQPLFMLVDVLNSRTSTTDLTLVWVILYFSILGNLAVVKPLLSSIYQSDEDDQLWKRILWIICELMVSVAVFGVFLGIGWLFFGYLNVSFTSVSVNLGEQAINITQPIPPLAFSKIVQLDQTFETRLTVPCFLLGLLCLLGYPILVCCGSCGLTALPISLIWQFRNRPKYRRTSDAKRILDHLKKQTLELIQKLAKTKRQMSQVQYVDGWWSRRKKKGQLNDIMKSCQEQFQFHKTYYELFHLQLKMQNVNPLVYIGKLILGVVCIFVSVILWIQILLAELVFVGTKNKGSVFLDRMLIFFEQENANFVSVAFLMLICIFLTIATIKGTMFFSSNMPFITIHPIVEGKTWLNSFFFQFSLCVLSSASLVHLILGSFPYYLRGGQIALMMGQILQGMHFLKFFIKNKIFIYAYLIMAIVGGIFVLVKTICFTQGKTQLLKEIQLKRKQLFGDKNKDTSLKDVHLTKRLLDKKDVEMKEVKDRKKQRQKHMKKIRLIDD